MRHKAPASAATFFFVEKNASLSSAICTRSRMTASIAAEYRVSLAEQSTYI